MYTSPFVDSYKQQLAALQSLSSPEALFNDIDALFKIYNTIKREYINEWKKYNTYQPQIRSFLETNNRSNTTIKISTKEVQSFVKTIKKLHASFTDWKHDLKTINNSPLFTRKPSINRSHCELYKSISLKNSNTSQFQLVQFKNKQKHCFHRDKTIIIHELVSPDLDFSVNEYKQVEMDILKPIHNVSSPKLGNRYTSIRSFGSIWSNEFQMDVVNNYKQSINKRFFIHNDDNTMELKDECNEKENKIVQYFRDNYYGQNEVFESAFGIRPVIYCDWTASGKILECVERYLSKEMYKLYA
eukprot:266421_1